MLQAEIDVLAAEGHTPQEATDAVAAELGAAADVRTGEQFGLDMAESVGGQAEMMRVALLLFAMWPFTRLVHAFTAPLHYLFRPYIVYRSRDDRLGSQKPRRGWERVQ